MNVSLIREEGGQTFLRTLSVDNLVKRIREGSVPRLISQLRDEILRLSAEDSSHYSRKLSRMVVSGCFRKEAEKVYMYTYQGIVGVSIDAPAGEPEIRLIRDKLILLPQALAVFAGSGGRSVKIWIRFCQPDGTLPDTEPAIGMYHAHACRWVANFIRGQLQEYQVWAQPDRPDYGYRLTHDPGLYYQPDALPIRMPQPMDMPDDGQENTTATPVHSSLQKTLPDHTPRETLLALFEAALTRSLQEAEDYYTREQWKEQDLSPLLTTLARYCFRSGIPEENTVREILHHFYHRLKEGIVRQLVGNVYRTERYFGRYPVFPKKMRLSLQIDEFMNRRYLFRFNTMTNQVEYHPRTRYKTEFQPVTERVLNTISMNALNEGLDLWDRDVKRWLYSDRVKLYKPMEEYLYTLPRWDGTERIRALAARIPCRQAHWEECFHRWFLSMVGHWMWPNPEYANAISPLMVGPQGCGKSTFCRNLLPPSLRSYYTDSIDLGSKRDAKTYLHRFALINMDEFDQVSPSQQGFVKNLLQKPSVDVRLAYESTVKEVRRYASFIGTSNHTDLLTDPSGSRRFICIEVTGKIDNQSPIHHAQLYAQAIHELNKGATYWFSAREEAQLMESNQLFEVSPASEQLFFQYFSPAREGEPYEKLLAVEILTRIRQRSKIRFSPSHIVHFGRILKKLKIPNKKTNRGVCYFVKEREETEE
ncbi:MAG: DUF3874 domain-containing protein [Bacteroides sp.]|nr:DUF3874 domain-containing protein [Bacteroides sp.]